MITGTGTDICSIQRIKDLLDRHGHNFAEKILTRPELEIFQKRSQNSEFLAGRFAAKEALYKAAGVKDFGFLDATILNDERGRPFLAQSEECFLKIGVDPRTKVHISISHEREHAVAFVILEKSDITQKEETGI